MVLDPGLMAGSGSSWSIPYADEEEEEPVAEHPDVLVNDASAFDPRQVEKETYPLDPDQEPYQDVIISDYVNIDNEEHAEDMKELEEVEDMKEPEDVVEMKEPEAAEEANHLETENAANVDMEDVLDKLDEDLERIVRISDEIDKVIAFNQESASVPETEPEALPEALPDVNEAATPAVSAQQQTYPETESIYEELVVSGSMDQLSNEDDQVNKEKMNK